VGGASAEREIELDTSVPQSVTDQYMSSMELCNALSAASGSAAKEDELSIDVTLLIPQTPADQTPEHEAGQTGTVPGVPAPVPESNQTRHKCTAERERPRTAWRSSMHYL